MLRLLDILKWMLVVTLVLLVVLNEATVESVKSTPQSGKLLENDATPANVSHGDIAPNNELTPSLISGIATVGFLVLCVVIICICMRKWRKEEEDRAQSQALEDPPSLPLGNASNGVLSNGVLSNGVLSNGVLSNGVFSNGVLSNSVLSNGFRSNGVPSNGILSNDGRSNSILKNGVRSNGLLSNGVLSNSIRSNSSRSNGVRSNGIRSNSGRSNGVHNNGVLSNDVLSNSVVPYYRPTATISDGRLQNGVAAHHHGNEAAANALYSLDDGRKHGTVVTSGNPVRADGGEGRHGISTGGVRSGQNDVVRGRRGPTYSVGIGSTVPPRSLPLANLDF